MSDYRLGISRNRVFAFNNAVCFAGTLKKAVEPDVLNNALSLLTRAEPLIGSKIRLQDDGEAFVTTASVVPVLEEFSGNVLSFLQEKRREGIICFHRLFRFFLCNGDTLVILGHTAVCDVKSLCALSAEWLSFCKGASGDILPRPVTLLSDKTEIPASVFSPLVDKVADSVNIKWDKKERFFSEDDFLKASKKFAEKADDTVLRTVYLDAEKTARLTARCEELSVDLSTAAAFEFFEVLSKSFRCKKKCRRLLFGADLRLYFENPGDYAVGPLSARITVIPPKKSKGGGCSGREVQELKTFHESCYKKFANPFNAYYNEILRFSVYPAVSDASYLYSVGILRGKPVKTFAESYGCAAKRLLAFDLYNFGQKHWDCLTDFCDILALEPFAFANSFSVTLLMQNNKLGFAFEYRKSIVGSKDVSEILSSVTDSLLSL